MTCSIVAGLKAGEAKTFTIVFTPHGTDSDTVANCAMLEGGDTPACATEAINQAETPPTPPAPIDRSKPAMLRLDKSTQSASADLVKGFGGDTGSCTLAGPCTFGIAITNTGGQPYAGQLGLTDVLMPANDGVIHAAQTMTGSSPDAKWSCKPSNNSSILSCLYNGLLVLGPGQSTLIKAATTVRKSAGLPVASMS